MAVLPILLELSRYRRADGPARSEGKLRETIRQWCLKFGQTIAAELRRRRPRPGDKWHLDEVYLKINGRTHYLWRAVDQEGVVLDILVQSRRNKQAAKRFLGRLLTGMQYAPRIIVTDKLKSYGAAITELKLQVDHRQHKGLNNRAENSHQPTRQRERAMRRFKSPEQAHSASWPRLVRSLSIFGRGVTA
jgi:putative transposase